MARIHILRPGKFRDLKGREVNLTQQDMEQIAGAYERNSAPVIVGHKDDPEDPAHGWAASLSADARGLWAEVPRLTKQMRGWISEGRYRKVSAKLLRDGSRWAVAHIGMLGARRPAVSGLDPVELAGSDDPGDVIFAEVELEAPSAQAGQTRHGDGGLVARSLARALDYFTGRGNDDPPSNQAGEGGSGMSDPNASGSRQGEDDLKAELAAARKREEALEKRLGAVELASKVSAAASKVKPAVEAGRLLPRWEAPMTALLASLLDDDAEAETIELAAAGDDEQARQLSRAELLEEFLSEPPRPVPQGEVSGQPAGPVQRVALGSGQPADNTAQAVDKRARELCAADDKLSYADAAYKASIELAAAS